MLLIIATVLAPTLSESSQSANIGSYTILYNEEVLPHIKISRRNADAGDTVIWFTSPTSKQLLIAEKVHQTVAQNGGDYLITETVQDICNNVSLYSFAADQQMVTVSGHLCDNHTFEICFTLQSHQHLGFNVTLHSNYYNKLRFRYGCNNDEGFFGLGEQYLHVNYKGQSVPLFISEQGVGRGAQPITLFINWMSPGAGMCVLYYLSVCLSVVCL